MKKFLLPLLILIVLGGVGAFLYFSFKPSPLETPQTTWGAISDSLKAKLPTDQKLAHKELTRVQKALAALQPTTPYIVIDTHSNHLTYRTADSVLYKFTCSTGSGSVLVDSVTKRKWTFDTPKGQFKVKSKIVGPWWRKPDWEYVQSSEPIPKDESERLEPNVLGDYALAMGDGYFIHGTLYKRLLGMNVTHGCVRLGDDDLKIIYDKAAVGTPIYIY